MHHRGKRDTGFRCGITIRLTLDVPAETLGLADGYRREIGNEGGRKKPKTGRRDGLLLTCRAARADERAPSGSVCEITAQEKAAPWETLSASDYFRYAEAAADACLQRIKERIKVDLAPHIDGVRIETPLTACLDRPEHAPEALLKNERKLFPERQEMRVTQSRTEAGLTVLTLQKTDGFTAAWFRPGQHVLLWTEDENETKTPYLLCSSPTLAKEGVYEAVPYRCAADGAAPRPFSAGDTVCVSSPRGNFHYDALRDRSTVFGMTDRDGVAVFLSMAAALRDGLEKFKITVLYLQKPAEEVPFFSDFERICRECSKVRLIPLPAENGVSALSAAALRRMLPHEAYSVFVCGASDLHAAAEKALTELHLPEKRIRVLSPDLPADRNPLTL